MSKGRPLQILRKAKEHGIGQHALPRYQVGKATLDCDSAKPHGAHFWHQAGKILPIQPDLTVITHVQPQRLRLGPSLPLPDAAHLRKAQTQHVHAGDDISPGPREAEKDSSLFLHHH